MNKVAGEGYESQERIEDVKPGKGEVRERIVKRQKEPGKLRREYG
jgi:hypothetical protein